MNESTDTKAIDVIEHLLVVCQDGVDGYRRAAEDVPKGRVKDFLASASAKREELASVLTNALVGLGHKPAHHGSVAAAAHRRWLDAVATVGRGSANGVLEECRRGEQQSLAAFTAALGRDLPEDAHRVVRDVFQRLLQASAALNQVAADLEVGAPEADRAGRVSDIMNPKLLYIREGDRLALAKAKILEFGVTAVPVLDDEHRPVAVVSLRDLVAHGEPVATSPARVVKGSATIREGAKVLAEAGVHHLVVVDEQGVALGMVSSVDFVRAFSGVAPRHPAPFAGY
jgi:uncharacterized protein (TIGR02284 family)